MMKKKVIHRRKRDMRFQKSISPTGVISPVAHPLALAISRARSCTKIACSLVPPCGRRPLVFPHCLLRGIWTNDSYYIAHLCLDGIQDCIFADPKLVDSLQIQEIWQYRTCKCQFSAIFGKTLVYTKWTYKDQAGIWRVCLSFSEHQEWSIVYQNIF